MDVKIAFQRIIVNCTFVKKTYLIVPIVNHTYPELTP